MSSKFWIMPIVIFALSSGFKSNDAEIAVQPLRMADSVNAAEIQLVPSVINIPETSEKFLVKEIKVLNKGGEPLMIHRVTPSCGCAAATVMNGTINPMTAGKIRLSMNTSGMSDTLNRVEFVIESNAKNSPTVYSVFVRRPKSVLKTSATE